MAFPNGSYRIETDNAVYNITFEEREINGQPRYELIDKRILQKNPDALMVEFAGARLYPAEIDLLMDGSKTKPPVFLVDVFPSEKQQANILRRKKLGMVVKGIGGVATVALIIREASSIQRMQSRAGVLFDKWYASREVQAFLRRFRKKELEMNSSRRKLLKIGAVALLGLLSEGIDPFFGRHTPGLHGISERIGL